MASQHSAASLLLLLPLPRPSPLSRRSNRPLSTSQHLSFILPETDSRKFAPRFICSQSIRTRAWSTQKHFTFMAPKCLVYYFLDCVASVLAFISEKQICVRYRCIQVYLAKLTCQCCRIMSINGRMRELRMCEPLYTFIEFGSLCFDRLLWPILYFAQEIIIICSNTNTKIITCERVRGQ